MAKEDIKLYENVAAMQARIEDFCERIDRVEVKIDRSNETISQRINHVDESVGEVKQSLSFWKGRMTAIAAVVAALFSLAIDKLWP